MFNLAQDAHSSVQQQKIVGIGVRNIPFMCLCPVLALDMTSGAFQNSFTTILLLDKNVLECQFANLYYYPEVYANFYKSTDLVVHYNFLKSFLLSVSAGARFHCSLLLFFLFSDC